LLRFARPPALGRRLRIQSQVGEDLLDDRPLEDGGNDLELAAAAVRAALHVDVESEASAKTNSYSSYVEAKTRLNSHAQLMRPSRILSDVPAGKPIRPVDDRTEFAQSVVLQWSMRFDRKPSMSTMETPPKS
jgi:hypothetical protein